MNALTIREYDWNDKATIAERQTQAQFRTVIRQAKQRGISDAAIVSMLKIELRKDADWRKALPTPVSPMPYIDIVFDRPPGPDAPRFIEVEDHEGKSIKFGEWVKRPDGVWALRLAGEASAGLYAALEGLVLFGDDYNKDDPAYLGALDQARVALSRARGEPSPRKGEG